MKIESVVPIIAITPDAKAKLDAYIGICKQEISGLGVVSRHPNWKFLIEDIILFSQEVTAGTTDLDEETLHQFLTEAVNQNLDPSALKLWWHSHVNGSCFWSGIDTETIDKALLGNDWMLSIVGNKKGEYKCRLDTYNPVRIALDELPLQLQQVTDVGLWKQLKEEVKEKVRKKKYTTYQGGIGDCGIWEKGKAWDKKNYRWAWPDEIEEDNQPLVPKHSAKHSCGRCKEFLEGIKICKQNFASGKFMAACRLFEPFQIGEEETEEQDLMVGMV